jgi:hypothetical protein
MSMNLRRTVLILICAASFLLLASCSDSGTTAVIGGGELFQGDGNVAVSELTVSGGTYAFLIEHIQFHPPASGKITINESLGNKVVLRTDENIAETIDISVDGGRINIRGDKSKSYSPASFEIEIGAAVNDVRISGGFSIDFNIASPDEFTADISGAIAGSIATGRLDRFALSISGTGSVSLSGEALDSSISLSGAGSVDAFEFRTVNSAVDISGTGNANVYATGTLTASVSVGSVVYDGNPETVNDNSGVTGTVRAR